MLNKYNHFSPHNGYLFYGLFLYCGDLLFWVILVCQQSKLFKNSNDKIFKNANMPVVLERVHEHFSCTFSNWGTKCSNLRAVRSPCECIDYLNQPTLFDQSTVILADLIIWATRSEVNPLFENKHHCSWNCLTFVCVCMCVRGCVDVDSYCEQSSFIEQRMTHHSDAAHIIARWHFNTWTQSRSKLQNNRNNCYSLTEKQKYQQ